MMGEMDPETGAQESLFEDMDDWDMEEDDGMMEESSQASPMAAEGSLSPVVIDLPDFEEAQPPAQPAEDLFNF